MEKAFAPRTVEEYWRARWAELGVGHADVGSDRPAYTIALPPPNITGALHLGHACGFSIQDTLARYHRMLGDEVEWCPGTDHAAIATQNVIERQLAAEGTSKEELGREAFQERVDAWYRDYGGRIYEQMQRLGFTCDYERARFTLDDAYVRAIRTVFKALFDDGHIYRGPRIVNWCPHNLSAISDEEIDWQEHTDMLVSLRYPVDGGGEIVVATVRPETMLGDAAVAVSPGDERYAHLVGRTVTLPLTGRQVPIIEDEAVERGFGTGALKVTPAHDLTDWEIGERHSLPVINVIAPDGTMDVPELPRFHGLGTDRARVEVTAALREAGAVVDETEYVHDVGHCDRCGTVLEPIVSEQWWVRMKDLAAPAIEVVESGGTTFHPRRYTEVYMSWMRNIRDWCISRQIWLGHAIPVTTCGNGHVFAWVESPSRCPDCGSTTLANDPDVLDTWFSSALWPFAIFGWPDRTEELDRFYPTAVDVTAREIIFLWVARMIITGIRFMGETPFRDVIITSTIQADDGTRMSKSKGNVVDPLEMIDRHGADAVRAWAGAVGTGGQDVRFNENRIESYRRFANKIWNVTRFLAGRLDDGSGTMRAPGAAPAAADLLAEDRWMLSVLAETVEAVDRAIAAYRFHEAMDRLYDVTWHSFADWYLEIIKARLRDDAPADSRNTAAHTAITTLDTLLRMLHVFMPFVTEECAQRIAGAAPTLQHRSWPSVAELSVGAGDAAARTVDDVITLVESVRSLRAESGVPDGSRHRLTLAAAADADTATAARLVALLLPVDVDVDGATAQAGVDLVAGAFRARYHMVLTDAERARAVKRIAELDDHIRAAATKLDNPAFRDKAPAAVVRGAEDQLAAARAERESLVARLAEGQT